MDPGKKMVTSEEAGNNLIPKIPQGVLLAALASLRGSRTLTASHWFANYPE
jgi:hypothetical protein